MNRHSLAIGLALGLVACAPVPAQPSASPVSTPHDTAPTSQPPSRSASGTTSEAPSPSASGHDMGDMGGSDESVEVDIANFAFEPVELTITAGTEVVFTNSDAAPHTVTAGTDDEPMPEAFDSGLLETGDEFRFVFDEPGEYVYFCERHPPMTGTIVVEP